MMSKQKETLTICSQTHCGELYVVIGSFVGRVQHIGLHLAYSEEIQRNSIFDNGIELWQYEPQKLIKKWVHLSNKNANGGSGFVYKQDGWEIVIGAISGSTKSTSQSSKSKGKSQERKKKTGVYNLKQTLKQKINMLTMNIQPQKKSDYYSNYSLLNDHYPSLSHSYSQNKIYQSCLYYVGGRQGGYNLQAGNIYGLNQPMKGSSARLCGVKKYLYSSIY